MIGVGKYVYPDTRIFIICESDKPIPGVTGYFERDLYLETELEEGCYTICCEVDWPENSKVDQRFAITSYGPQRIEF